MKGQYYSWEFLKDQPDKKFNCMIYYQVIIEPVTLICGANHTFGMACIKAYLK